MFENFDAFKDDFMEKIGSKLPSWRTNYSHDKKMIIVEQTKTTEQRSFRDGWYDVHNDWDEDYEILRREIIDAVSFFYFNGQTFTNRFVNAVNGINIDWIGDIDYDFYTDYYDRGEIQRFTIYLDKLFDLIYT